jgi:hypothetical protein
LESETARTLHPARSAGRTLCPEPSGGSHRWRGSEIDISDVGGELQTEAHRRHTQGRSNMGIGKCRLRLRWDFRVFNIRPQQCCVIAVGLLQDQEKRDCQALDRGWTRLDQGSAEDPPGSFTSLPAPFFIPTTVFGKAIFRCCLEVGQVLGKFQDSSHSVSYTLEGRHQQLRLN